MISKDLAELKYEDDFKHNGYNHYWKRKGKNMGTADLLMDE